MREVKTNSWVQFLPNVQYIMNINMPNHGQNPNLGLKDVLDGGNEEGEEVVATTSKTINLIYLITLILIL